MEQNIEIAIKSEIEQVFGRRVVSSRDCIELSNDIYHKTKYQLNSNTLRRFFSLVKAVYPPSLSTISILSKYCGFQSPDDLLSIKKNDISRAGMVNQESVLHHFVSIFNIEVKDSDDETFLNMVSHIIEFIEIHRFLADRFQGLVSRTENGPKFYFEQFVNIDKLNSFYGTGLRYYVTGKGTEDAEMYADSLYVLQNWLNGDDDALVRLASQKLRGRHANFEQRFMYGRYFSALLLYLNVTDGDSQKTLIDIQHFHHALALEYHGTSGYFMFVYVICEALAITGHYDEVLHYVQLSGFKKSVPKYGGPLNYYNNLLLWEAFALYRLGQQNQAAKIFDRIKAPDFCFLNKKFSHIYYLYLLREIEPKSGKYEGQLDFLIAETGFLRFRAVFGSV